MKEKNAKTHATKNTVKQKEDRKINIEPDARPVMIDLTVSGDQPQVTDPSLPAKDKEETITTELNGSSSQLAPNDPAQRLNTVGPIMSGHNPITISGYESQEVLDPS